MLPNMEIDAFVNENSNLMEGGKSEKK